MSKSRNTFQKQERAKKKQQRRKGKQEKKAQKKEGSESTSLEDMMVYVDENGNFSKTPPKEKDKTMEIDASQIDVSTPKSAAMDMDAERRGVVKFYNQQKGFGFIIPQGGQEQYFFHGTSVTGEVWDHDKVKFKLERGEKGFDAVEVKKIS